MLLLPIDTEANTSPEWAEASADVQQLNADKALIIFSGSPMAVPVITTTCGLGLGQVTGRCHETSRSCSLPRRTNSLPATKKLPAPTENFPALQAQGIRRKFLGMPHELIQERPNPR